ncbi:hypothetical protein DESUT3_15790 [Desulfuromonas versatilis]|uniref:SPOR domain-containing protein n=1 Tax=Desulfuromonas versatilis TaxID=2802975 RepID=A0ABM8HTZ4_9BACT|nr:SPOR domain-containing protein [Desulfuromonas versatilis]BCR04510.1 hypothetical protein DESUT3_15790 [Desulfuromonas versatilis]
MADNQDWQWEEEESKAKGGEGQGDVPAEEIAPAESPDEPARTAARGSATRILLLVLLLTLVGGAGYYYFAGVPLPEEPAADAGRQKQPIVMPMPIPPKEEPASVEQAPAAAEAPLPKGVLKEVIVPQQVAAAGPASPEAQPPGEAQAPAQPAPEQADAGTEAAAPPAQPAAGPAEAKPAKTEPAKAVKPAAGVRYLVQSAVYTDRKKLDAARAALKKFGFEPKVSPVKSTLEMTRLRIGVFSPQQAKNKLRELHAGAAPDAFSIAENDQVKVYAASYYDLDKARGFADQLFQRGVKVAEEAATVEVTLSKLSFGDFTERSRAEQAAEQARSAGIEALVVQKP